MNSPWRHREFSATSPKNDIELIMQAGTICWRNITKTFFIPNVVYECTEQIAKKQKQMDFIALFSETVKLWKHLWPSGAVLFSAKSQSALNQRFHMDCESPPNMFLLPQSCFGLHGHNNPTKERAGMAKTTSVSINLHNHNHPPFLLQD